MKKIIQIILVIILFSTAGFIFWTGLYPKVVKPLSSEEILGSKGEVIIKGQVWGVGIAKTDEERVAGLSNRQVLHNKTGLLFVFDQMSTQSFWMKDMLIPIDMIFFDDKWQIVGIETNLSPKSFPKIFGNKIKSQYVLEVNANESVVYGLRVGDQAVFRNK